MRRFSLSMGRISTSDRVAAWIDKDNSAIMVISVAECGDPVELLPGDAREFAHALLKLAEEFDRLMRP